ncbi:L-galactose dehydrogenase-like [Durio zibethinus]|uniref:L-galactose dehydrogenase-like n=1 Tax=Durio zibethinus TaxID=66656 RepID=A0A6P5XAX6_DURZI|nr:L-galactose dehydrogenase-like [Durio zibethinus]
MLHLFLYSVFGPISKTTPLPPSTKPSASASTSSTPTRTLSEKMLGKGYREGFDFSAVDETIPALQELTEAVKIRFIGITGLPLETFTYGLDRVPPGTIDVILSYCYYSINDSSLEDLLPYLKNEGQCISTCYGASYSAWSTGGASSIT